LSCITHSQEVATDCMVLDFKELKKVVNREVVSKYDHQNLNDFFANPTAEVMVVSMFFDIQASLPKDIKLESVKLWETEGAYAEFRGEM
jgi:6-pyruvoyltetrahydropterin/6-carboxytetrahydropterin synthase